jgi:hypothetical protein
MFLMRYISMDEKPRIFINLFSLRNWEEVRILRRVKERLSLIKIVKA